MLAETADDQSGLQINNQQKQPGNNSGGNSSIAVTNMTAVVTSILIDFQVSNIQSLATPYDRAAFLKVLLGAMAHMMR